MSEIFAYLFYFIAASASPLQRRWLAKNKNHTNEGQIVFSFYVTLIVCLCALSLLLYQPFKIQGNIYLIIFLTIICGLFGMMCTVLLYRAQKYVEAGVSSILSNMYTPVTIILSSLFLGEGLTFLQIIGTVFLLFGAIIVAQKHKIGKFKFDKYFWMMIFSGITLGVLIFSERYLQKITGFTTGTLLSWYSILFFLGIASLFEKQKLQYNIKDITITGFLRFFQNLSWVILVYTVGNLSIVSSITTFKIVIMFIFGALFLGEKEDFKRKIAGSIIAFIGLLIIK